MSRSQKEVLLGLPKRIINLSVEYGEEPDASNYADFKEADLLKPEEAPVQRVIRLIDLMTLQPELFRPLLDEKSSTDPNIIQAFENGLPPELALKTNLVSFFWLTGTSYKDVKTNIAALKDVVLNNEIPKLLKLVPEPGNPYDPYCIKVFDGTGGWLGYVPKKANVNREVGEHLQVTNRLIGVQIAMIEDGRKGYMLALACGWDMPPELLLEDNSEPEPTKAPDNSGEVGL